jgi:hypothetical protein
MKTQAHTLGPWFIKPEAPFDICAPDQFIGADRMSQVIAHATADGLYRSGVTSDELIQEARGNAAYIAHAATRSAPGASYTAKDIAAAVIADPTGDTARFLAGVIAKSIGLVAVLDYAEHSA